MIDVKELRIGNIVSRRGSHEELAVDIDLFIKISRHPIFFEPIKLTEEWLLKFGFAKDEDQLKWGYLDFTKGSIYIRLNIDSTFYRDGHKCLGDMKHLKCVHQLQNLYFALTGTELTLQA